MEKQSNALFRDAGQNICLGVASPEDTGFSSCASPGLVHAEQLQCHGAGSVVPVLCSTASPTALMCAS